MAGLGRVLKVYSVIQGISLYTLFMLVIHTVSTVYTSLKYLQRGNTNGIETWHLTNDRSYY